MDSEKIDMNIIVHPIIRKLCVILIAVFACATAGAPIAALAQDNQSAAPDDVTAAAAFTLQQKFAAADGAASDAYGRSVALSGDTAVVGSPLADVNGKTDQGVAYVYLYKDGAWTPQAKLIAPDIDTNRQFGYTVAIDGNTVVVGARSPNKIGAAYVFVRSGAGWSPQAKLVPADEVNDDRFGEAVAINADTIVVGAPLHDLAGTADKNRGAAYVFTRTGATWTQQAKLTAADAQDFQFFGVSVAVDGNTAMVGAPGGSGIPAYDPGSAYVFTRAGTQWSQQAKLTALDPQHQQLFGDGVSLSGDTAAVGAPSAKIDGASFAGAAYIFIRANGGWFEQAKLTALDPANSASLGFAVSLNKEAVAIGAYGNKIDGKIDQGSAYLFKRTGIIWSQQAKLTAADGAAKDLFGASVALADEFIVVGASQKSISSNNQVTTTQPGAAYIFSTIPKDSSPKIQGVSVKGKKLIVTGVNFDAPTEIYVNGQKTKKTSNDELNPTTTVVAKKAGQQIARGQTVMVQVKNATSGVTSNEYMFTRPLD